MGSKKSIYICQNCGFQLLRWAGKCPECEAWNSITEEIARDSRGGKNKKIKIDKNPLSLNKLKTSKYIRIVVGMDEIDRVLGGGVVEGAVVLIGGEPGIGKTTLLYQIADKINSDKRKVLYISGEESVQQAKLRTERLDINSEDIYLINEVDLDIIKVYIDKVLPKIVVIDSVQVMSSGNLDSSPGTISQIREVVNQLSYIAKLKNITIFLVGHITKKGNFAGPKFLEHMVDTVLYFEGERYSNYRMVKCIKNRFGSTDEIGFFDMTSKGLKEIKNPSEMFISERADKSSGSVIVPIMEGTRAVLVEIQALVSESTFGNPIRRTSGVDYNKVSLLLAVLEKRAGLILKGMDVFVKVTGGIKIFDPSIDLAVCTAIASSFRNIPVRKDEIVIGEVGLGGEIRTVANINQRLKEAAKIGFKRCILPSKYKDRIANIKNMELEWVDNINKALDLLLR